MLKGKCPRLAFLPIKNARGRNIRLTNLASTALENHRARQLEEKQHLGGLYRDQDLVFASRVGTPLNPSNVVNRSFKPLLKRAALPNIRFHDLRHTCATLLLAKGVHPKIAQDRLGHATIAVTMNTYSHVTPHMQEQAATALDDALS
jgi:integrase